MARTEEEEIIFKHVCDLLARYPSSWEAVEANARAGDIHCKRLLAERMRMRITTKEPPK